MGFGVSLFVLWVENVTDTLAELGSEFAATLPYLRGQTAPLFVIKDFFQQHPSMMIYLQPFPELAQAVKIRCSYNSNDPFDPHRTALAQMMQQDFVCVLERRGYSVQQMGGILNEQP
jgi:hypothetical protein